MKRILKMTAFALVIMLGSSLLNKTSAQYNSGPGPGDDVSYQTFYDELSPYGDWIEYPGYGYVWQPQVGDDFRPYSSGGQWVWSDDYEWMWVSDYDWGWAPFHYGRWFQDEDYGWLWQPGYEWSSAWVAWRDGGDYYGWAPLRPGINISVNFNIGGYNPPNDYWCFAPRRYITSRNIGSYCIDRRQNYSIINVTTIINNYNYGGNYGFRTGPRRYDAERYCGPIRSVSFRQSYTPGRTQFRNNVVNIYRPSIRQDNNRNYSPRQFNQYERGATGGNFRNGRTNTDQGRIDNRNRNINNDGNNRVGTRDRSENAPFRRNDNTVRQPQQNNNPVVEHRRMERTDNNNGQQPGGGRVIRPTEQPDRNPNQGNQNSDRRFERRNDNNVNTPVRQPEVRNNNSIPQREPRQRMEPRQQEQQQPRQRMEPRQQEQQQPRQRVEQSPQPQRQMERRENTSRPQNNNTENRGNGNGGGRGRRF